MSEQSKDGWQDEDDFYEGYDEDVCDHDDHDVDILTGRANCWRCGEAWWLTDAELKREIELQAQMWVCFETEDAPLPTPPAKGD